MTLSAARAQMIADRLTRNQRGVIRSLNVGEPLILGCIETVAHRLTQARSARPALVKHCGSGSFVLTAEGSHVKAYL